MLPTHHRWGMVQWGRSQRVGLESVQFSKPTVIEKMKFQCCKHSHIWIPNTRTRLKSKWTVCIKEEDRRSQTTLSSSWRDSCQARIDSYINQNQIIIRCSNSGLAGEMVTTANTNFGWLWKRPPKGPRSSLMKSSTPKGPRPINACQKKLYISEP